MSDEEYVALSSREWARLYSCAAQYHMAEVKPQGLVMDADTGLIVVIKKTCLR